MKKLLSYLKDYKKESILAPIFKMLEATFELLVPLVMAAVIDKGIANKDTPYIIKMCLIMILLGVVGLICSSVAQYYAAKAAVGFGSKLRHALFSHIQGLSFTKQDQAGTATLITRMTSDVNQVQNGVNMVLRLFLRSPFIVFGAMVMAFTIDVRAALVFVVTIPALSVVVFGVMYVSIPLYKKVQAKLDEVLKTTRENLTGVRVIRAFHLENEEIKKYGQRNDELTRMQLFVGRISALMNPVTYVIINGATAYLIYQGAIQVDGGVITQGEVVALVNYMSQILVELIKLANLIITVTKAFACANRIQGVFEISNEVIQLDSTFDGVNHFQDEMVSFQNVGLTYHNAAEESLSDITFSVKKGETIGIIGGTGSGKTSLVHLIPGFYPNTRGCIRIDGKNIEDYDSAELREKIGIVMQQSVLFKGTIEENLRWGKRDASQEELTEALKTAQAYEVVTNKAGGMQAPVSQGGKNFSGGQRQRLTIARAIIRKPDILILDDSASALDYATDAALRTSLREMKERPTVFIVSQRASSIRYADKILVLDDGMLKGAGTHAELLRNCSVYQEIYYSQYPKQEKGGEEA